ncbi:MAG: heavy-metal-associated domain-containing protein [Bacteroidota bacterium]
MKNSTITINGMTCGHCAMAVKKELTKINGVTVNEVGVGKAAVSFDENAVTEQSLKAAVEEAGYSVISIQ